MNKKIEMIKGFRLHLLKQLNGLTTHQLNHIPAGYNNNIIWNVAHLICVQQSMCYTRSGLPLQVPEAYCAPYMPGTKPENPVNEHDIKIIQELLITTIDQLQVDVDRQLFTSHTPSVMIPKVYGFEVTNIDEVLAYLLHHEGFHIGYIQSLKHTLADFGL